MFEFNYRMLANEFLSTEAVDIYIPLPLEDGSQRILEQTIRSSIPGESGVEARYGNGYFHIHRPANINNPIDADLSWTVERRVAGDVDEPLTAQEREQFLAPNQLVPVGHEVLEPILAEVHAMRVDESPAATARAIYDWVVDNVEYKKVGTGWGNGDTFWACSERYGNCTDFHALFISLARSEGIPARFEIGFPVPDSREEGEIGGYHCWVRFHLPDRGWVPIDASEAAKNPAQRELFYGTQPADRIHFSTGRDLVLTEASKRQPLNYFIYPYVELGGIPWRAKVETSFSFREVTGG
ncbi:transglutaminase-like domain-containing protein [Halioglobus maricola]|uniref:transglutaminase-like domain-containing protein n=1 Tax=Halioglobus maricola TaxID=2601894 RepID=UPI00197A99DC|nr:transglutaminase-like domain-containing protein [Halioglobus maricola]